jgi:hypothetical protein
MEELRVKTINFIKILNTLFIIYFNSFIKFLCLKIYSISAKLFKAPPSLFFELKLDDVLKLDCGLLIEIIDLIVMFIFPLVLPPKIKILN